MLELSTSKTTHEYTCFIGGDRFIWWMVGQVPYPKVKNDNFYPCIFGNQFRALIVLNKEIRIFKHYKKVRLFAQ